MTRIAVAGGSGQIGARVVARLRDVGHEVVVLSRAAGVDLVGGTQADTAQALTGVETVVDCTSTPSQKRAECVAFFGTVAGRLQSAGATAGVDRIVTLSIVGIDAAAGRGHYAGKLAQEAATRGGSVPWTILRATQFHTFGASLIAWVGRSPLLPCPTGPVQPVDLDVVTSHLVRLALTTDPVSGTLTQLAGPQVLTLPDVVRRTARARGRRGLVVPLRLPGAAERACRRGALLAPPDALVEGRSFDEWIAAGAPV